MTIEQSVFTLLTSDATLVALVGTRVYPVQAPESATFPLVVYQMADQQSVMTYAGPQYLNRYAMDLTAWGTSYGSVKAVIKAVRDALNGHTGTTLGVRVLGVFDQSEVDEHEIPQHADERGLFAVSLNLMLWHKPSA